MLRRSTAPLLALLTACIGSPALPPDAAVTCATDVECPAGTFCSTEIGLCLPPGTDVNTAPQVVVTAIARQIGTVSFDVIITDGEGDPVTLDIEYDDGSGFKPAAVTVPAIVASRTGTRVTVTWDAALDRGTSTFASGFRVRVTPSDGEAAGEAVVSDPFDVGDDVPTVVAFETVGAESESLTGNVIVRFFLEDAARDTVTVSRLEVTHDGSFSDVPALLPNATLDTQSVIPSGSLARLETAATGVEHRVTWASALTSVVDAPNSLLRITFVDDFSGETVVATSAPFYLRNQLPPRLTRLRAPSAQTRRSPGPVVIAYTLIDENSDPADVAIEYSLDGGTSFERCVEYRVPESEGTAALATAPELFGGVEHVFVWDSSGVAERSDSNVRIRATVDGGSSNTIALGGGVGPTLGAPYTSLFGADVFGFPDSDQIAIGHFDDDPTLDVYQGASDIEILYRGCRPMPCFESFDTLSFEIGTITHNAAGDIDGDGRAELVVTRTNPDRMTIRFSTNDYGASSQIALLSEQPDGLLMVDVDGDTQLDIVSHLGAEITVRFSLDASTFSAPTTTMLSGAIVVLKPTDVDGDARADLLVTAGSTLSVIRGQTDRTNPFEILSTTLPFTIGFADSGDVDDDGVLDVFLGGFELGSRVAWWNLGGVGDWTERGIVPVAPTSLTDLTIGDANGDGRDDLIHGTLVGFTSYDAGFLPNRGVGEDGRLVFGARVLFGTPPGPSCMFARDMDGDGFDESFMCDDFDLGGYTVFSRVYERGVGTGAYGSPEEQIAGEAEYGGWAPSDLDGDGILDHVFYNLSSEDVEVWFGQGIRGLATGDLVGPLVTNVNGVFFTFAGGDADDDGLGDLWLDGPSGGEIYRGLGDGTFADPVAAERPADFYETRTAFYDVPPGSQGVRVDVDGDGIRDGLSGTGRDLEVSPGLYTERRNYDALPEVAPALKVINDIFDIIDNQILIGDLNADGFSDLVLVESRFENRLYFAYGQNEAQRSRSLAIEEWVAVPARAEFRVSSPSTNLIGATLSGHVARVGVQEPLIDWWGKLISEERVTVADHPLTPPFQLFGARRLRATTSDGQLEGQDRLALDASTDEALVVDLPIFEVFTAAEITTETPRLFLRVTDYTELDPDRLRRSHAWVEIPRDEDDDLTTGSGRRFAIATAADGSELVRAWVDRLGVLQAYLQTP